MKRAVALIPVTEILQVLKIPLRINIIKMLYDESTNGNMKITLEGDDLPTKEISATAKKLPEVDYEIRASWHRARITEKIKETKNANTEAEK